jgi:hypothetical protein
MTYDICRMALERGIPGDFVECGVYAGASSAIMAKAIMEHVANRGEYALSDNRRVHLFDSFEGIPLAGPEDLELAHKPAGEAKCSLEDVKRNMRDWGIPDELLAYWPGWFSETVPWNAGVWQGQALAQKKDPKQLIAVLRLDADLTGESDPGASVTGDESDSAEARRAESGGCDLMDRWDGKSTEGSDHCPILDLVEVSA